MRIPLHLNRLPQAIRDNSRIVNALRLEHFFNMVGLNIKGFRTPSFKKGRPPDGLIRRIETYTFLAKHGQFK